MEPDQPEFLAGGFLEPLDDYIDLKGLEDWAKPAWTSKGKVYGVPVEAYTVELYYNKDLLKKVGVEVPASAQLTQAQFADLVKKGVAAGITPVSQGVGDRPFPGALLTYESLLRKLGKAGASRWRGIRPTVRGVAQNPVDHPHGGGEGKTSGGRHPVTPWGQPTKGYKTRKNKRTQSMIVRDRRSK